MCLLGRTIDELWVTIWNHKNQNYVTELFQELLFHQSGQLKRMLRTNYREFIKKYND